MTETFTLTVRDDLLYESANEPQLLTLFLPRRTLTVRELIEERVRQEVQAYNERLPERFRGLVTPTHAERALNGLRVPRQQSIDADQQCQLALQAFQQNGFLLLVDEQQVADLDEVILLRPDSSVVFLKLTPLVGG